MAGLGAMLVVASSLTCGQVQQIELGVCGNGVLEPNRGEDCDSVALGEGTVCEPPGSRNACRYSCAAPPTEDGPHCPAGWGCGRDGLCRVHASAFSSARVIPAVSGAHLLVEDFDGDGLDDISWHFADRFTVTHVSPNSSVTHEVPTGASNRAQAADVNGDGRADWLIPGDSGLRAFRGAVDREPKPTTFQSIPLTIDVEHFIPVDLIPDVVIVDGQPMSFSGEESILVQPDLDRIAAFNRATRVVDDIDDGPTALLHGSLAAELDGTRQEFLTAEGPTPEELAVPYRGPDRVVVYRPTFFIALAEDVPPDVTISFNTQTPTEIDVPAPIRVLGAVHANPVVAPSKSAHVCMSGPAIEDAHLDLVIETEAGLYVAYGRGDGSFHSDPCTLDTSMPDNMASKMSRYSMCDGFPVHALAHLDDDGALDVVTVAGVWTSALMGSPTASRFCDFEVPLAGGLQFGGWTDAVVGDFDGDGHRDVLGVSEFGGIDFVAGSGGPALTETHLPTNGVVEQITVGDFDADGVSDLAFVEDRGTSALHLAMLFGGPASLFSSALELGTVDNPFLIDAFQTGSFVAQEADDLVIGRDPSPGDVDPRRFVGFVAGSADRALSSQFVQAYSFSEENFYIPETVGLGLFRDGDVVEAALFGLSIAGFSDPTRSAHGVGLASARADGSLALIGDDAVPADLHPWFQLQDVVSVVFDADGDNRDEMLAISVGFEDPLEPWESELRLLLGGFDEAGAWREGGVLNVRGVSLFGQKVETGDPSNNRVQPITRDPQACFFDGGRVPHVLVGALERNKCSDGAAPIVEVPETVLYALSPADSAALSEGKLTALPEGARIAFDDADAVVGFACLNADADADDELAVLLVDAPLSSCDVAMDSVRVPAKARIVIMDNVGGEFGEPRLVASLDSQLAESLVMDPEARGPVLAGLAAGDVDGDGVQDLVLGAGGVTLLFAGKPVTP